MSTHKKIFGSFFSPSFCSLEKRVGFKGHIYGAETGMINYYRNIIKYGTFDEYHIFIPTASFEDEDERKNILSFFNNDSRVVLRDTLELISAFKDTQYTVFFKPKPYLADLVYLRNNFAKRQFPVCGVTWTISYSEMIKDVFAENILSGMQNFDCLICVSRAVVRAVKKLNELVKNGLSYLQQGNDWEYTGSLRFLPSAVDCDYYKPYDKKSARNQLGLSKDKIIILFFGRLSLKDKADLSPFIYAFKKLVKRYKNKILFFIAGNIKGNVEYARLLMLLVKSLGLSGNVTFLFNPPMKDNRLIYSSSDIFISPIDNLQESSGFAPLEAMASGLPLVISDFSGYRDMVIHGKNGFLIPTLWAECDWLISTLSHMPLRSFFEDQLYLAQSISVDMEKMIEYLSLLIEDERLRLKLGANARERALQVFDWKVLIPRHESLWQEMSAIARKQNVKRKSQTFYPQYFKCFNHFPSQLLQESAKLVISPRGKESLIEEDLPWQVGILNRLFFSNKVKDILSFINKKGGATVREIKNKFNGMDKQTITYHIMWMLKHYLIVVR